MRLSPFPAGRRGILSDENAVSKEESRWSKCVSRCRIARFMPPLAFKPDESVDLYGDDEDDDDGEDSPENQGPDLQLMAAFLANRLGRAYLKNKLRQASKAPEESLPGKPAMAEPANTEVAGVSDEVEVAGQVDETDSTTENTTASSTIDEASEDTTVVAEEAEVEEMTESSCTEKVEMTTESPSESTDDNTITDDLEREDEKGQATDAEHLTQEEATTINDFPVTESTDTETDTPDVETIEVPSLTHEKEGDRNIGLADEFVETIAGEEVDGSVSNWTIIPEIPEAISLKFGRPLPVVEDGVPPIRG